MFIKIASIHNFNLLIILRIFSELFEVRVNGDNGRSLTFDRLTEKVIDEVKAKYLAHLRRTSN